MFETSRLVIASVPDSKKKLVDHVIKTVVDADTYSIPGRNAFQPISKLLFVSDIVPIFMPGSEQEKRLIVIPLTTEFAVGATGKQVEADPELISFLMSDEGRSEVVAWLIKGASRWISDNSALIDNLPSAMDIVSHVEEWATECIEETPGDNEERRNFIKSYKGWMDTNYPNDAYIRDIEVIRVLGARTLRTNGKTMLIGLSIK
jgi:hypothetical protein